MATALPFSFHEHSSHAPIEAWPLAAYRLTHQGNGREDDAHAIALVGLPRGIAMQLMFSAVDAPLDLMADQSVEAVRRGLTGASKWREGFVWATPSQRDDTERGQLLVRR